MDGTTCGARVRKHWSSGCDGALLRRTVLGILMYQNVHSGPEAPRALYCIRLAHLLSVSLCRFSLFHCVLNKALLLL